MIIVYRVPKLAMKSFDSISKMMMLCILYTITSRSNTCFSLPNEFSLLCDNELTYVDTVFIICFVFFCIILHTLQIIVIV